MQFLFILSNAVSWWFLFSYLFNDKYCILCSACNQTAWPPLSLHAMSFGILDSFDFYKLTLWFQFCSLLQLLLLSIHYSSYRNSIAFYFGCSDFLFEGCLVPSSSYASGFWILFSSNMFCTFPSLAFLLWNGFRLLCF